jgi:hypothetical protein
VLGVIAQPAPDHHDYHAEEFDGGVEAVPGALQVKAGFTPGTYGWYLRPGTSGELTYTIHKTPGEDIRLLMWLYSGRQVSATLSAGLDRGPPALVARNPTFNGDAPTLPADTRRAAMLELVLTATNQSSTESLVLDRLTFSSGPLGGPYPNARWSNWALGALAGLLSLPLVGRHRGGAAIAIGIALMVGAATDLRLHALIDASRTVWPNPDTSAYQVYADRFRWWPPNQGLLCGCFGPREPVWIAIAHLSSQLLGSSTFHLRATTALLAIGNVPLAIVAARRRLSWVGALAVGALLAFNGNVIENAVQGLRTELEMMCCLGLYILVDRDAARQPLLEGLAIGLLGTMLVLTRSFFLPVVILMAVLSLLIRYRRLRLALPLLALTIGLPLAGLTAHRVAMYETGEWYGSRHDAFLDTQMYARWNANIEKFHFGRQLPHPELFPSREVYDTCGPFCGPSLTYTQYLFELHSPRQVVVDSLDGYADVLVYTTGFLKLDASTLKEHPGYPAVGTPGGIGWAVDALARALGLVGLIGMLVAAIRRPRHLFVPAMFSGILTFVVFSYHLRLVSPYVNVIQAWPFLFIAGVWLAERSVIALWDDETWDSLGRRVAPLRHLSRAAVPFVAAALSGALGLTAFYGHGRISIALLTLVTALAVAAACLIDPVTGLALLVAALLLVPGQDVGAVIAASGLGGLLLALRPRLRDLLPAAPALPLALFLALSGVGRSSPRPHLGGLAAGALVLALTAGLVLVLADPGRRRRLLQLLPLTACVLAGAGLIIGLAGRWPPLYAAAPATLLVALLPALVGAMISWQRARVAVLLALSVAVTLGMAALLASSGRAEAGAGRPLEAMGSIVAAHPLLGVGAGRLPAVLDAAQPGLGAGLTAPNQFVQTAAEAGLLGLAGLIVLVLWAAIRSLAAEGRARPVLLGALGALVLLMAFQPVLVPAAGTVGALILLGLCLGMRSTRGPAGVGAAGQQGLIDPPADSDPVPVGTISPAPERRLPC